jgi:hypothetical protein
MPLSATTTLPVVAPEGTIAEIDVPLQSTTEAAVPLKVTVLVPCDGPKFVPVMVTNAPTTPDAGDRLPIVGEPRTVNATPLEAMSFSVTTTLPVVASKGTITVIDVGLQFETVAVVPLKVTVLVPCDAPKFVPAMVTDAPTAPHVRDRLLMVGVTRTVKLMALLTLPPAVTVTGPLVAFVGIVKVTLESDQLVGATTTPLIAMDPRLPGSRKLEPVTVKLVPANPDVELMLEITGGGSEADSSMP